MQYNYDYFISYAHKDNVSEDGKPGFVDEFVKKLKNDSIEHKQMFGGEIDVFFDKSEIQGMSDWDDRIRSSLASSRFLIVLLSPNYFKSEYCAREFDWWIQHEMHRRVLGEGTAPILIVDVADMYNDKVERIPDIPEDLQKRFPNWRKQICAYQNFDLHNLDRAKISDILNSLREGVKDRVMHQEAAELSPHTGLYPKYNENFVGRRENLRALRKSLNEKTAACYSALTGLGGFGKTELALTYGHAFAWDYLLGRVFANCENKTSLTDILLKSGIAEMHGWTLPEAPEGQQENFEERQISALFKRLKDKQNEIVQSNQSKKKLNTLGAHILLILDNVNNCKLVSKKNLAILPDFFHVIITTRENTNELSHLDQASIQSVEQLSEDESVELLSNIQPFATADEAIAARKIAKLLSGFTLIVELTGAYLHKCKHITYQKQYDKLVLNHAEVFQKMADKTGDLTIHAAETVAAVLDSTLSELSPNALKALDFASLMPPDSVALGWMPDLLGLDEDEGWEVYDELTGYSILTPLDNEPNIARIHRLVADTIKQKIPADAQKEINAKILEKCNSLLEKGQMFWCASENSWNITPVSDFCMSLVENWTVEASEEEIDWNIANLLNASVVFLNTLGKKKEAKKVVQRFNEISEERVRMFPSNVKAQAALSVSYDILGDLEKAIGNIDASRIWCKKGLEIVKRLAEKMPEDVQTQHNLSVAYANVGDYELDAGNITAARECYKNVEIIAKRLAEMMPEDVIKAIEKDVTETMLEDVDKKVCEYIIAQKGMSVAYKRLGIFKKSCGNTDAARGWFEKSLDVLERLADKMPESVDVQREISYLYKQLGNIENDIGNAAGARILYEKALKKLQQLAEKMPKHVDVQQGLSALYDRLGDWERNNGNTANARDMYEKALEIVKRLADELPEHIDVQMDLSDSYGKLSRWEAESGNMVAAKSWSKKDLKTIKHIADINRDNFVAQRNLCLSYMTLGALEKASGNLTSSQGCYDSAQEIVKKLVDKTPDDIIALRFMCYFYESFSIMKFADGNPAAAKIWHEKALKIYQRLADKMPDDYIVLHDLAKSLSQLGYLEYNTKKMNAARTYYEKSLEIYQRLFKIAPMVSTVQWELSTLYIYLGDLEKDSKNIAAARDWFEKSVEINNLFNETMPENDVVQRNEVSYTRLGDLEKNAGNFDAARKWHKKSLELAKKLADAEPENYEAQRQLINSYGRLCAVELRARNIAAAKQWYKMVLGVYQKLANSMPNNIKAQSDLKSIKTLLTKLDLLTKLKDSFPHNFKNEKKNGKKRKK